MKILALDSATTGCSAAVWQDGYVTSRRLPPMDRGQAEQLVPLVLDVMEEAEVVFSMLNRIAVAVGPGAFTGVRIALAAARGFALGTGAEIVGVTTFQAVFAAVDIRERANRTVLAAVDSRRSEPFLQLFGVDGKEIGEPAMLPPDRVDAWLPEGPLLVAGDGAAALRLALAGRADTAFADGPGWPDAAVIAGLAARLPAGSAAERSPPEPFYIRPPDVTVGRSAP